MNRTTRTTRRAATLLAAAAVATLCGTVPAQAADGPTAPAATDYAAAQKVLGSGQVHDTVSRFLTAAEQRTPAAGADGGTAAAPRGLAKSPAAPGFDLKKPVPFYELAPEFVTGKAKPTAGTALRLSYLASRVSASGGHQAAVLLAPGKGGGDRSWELAGIRDGDADISAAERGTDQARTFMEPQIHAWYRLTGGGTVEPLNKEAGVALQGKSRVTLAAYQQLVSKRYGDKLPGSAYDRKGMAGGYALAEDRPATASSRPWLPAASGAAALAVSGAVVVGLRRRNRSA
ncbi:hypothetical protein [Streptomyces griseocarneus]|uniref:hypothetical protein n=1 Tax=Streptomyces griseocarneus TaxID=51201 RepID=UPI00167DFC0C|nr:hypothetical protein [Streptomyces griseocarneus]MBZ6474091.1 hypothetical protein [Streptomyces griseocarneus]GHG52053.1 hypothetical protein GCM10018779_12790 [Streptomyces griseocarneus]